MKDTKQKKPAEKGEEVRETPVGFFTTDEINEAVKAEAKAANRSRSRHIHAILAARYAGKKARA